MAKGKRTGASHSGYYASYKAGKRWEKNRLRKLEQQLKEQPGNAEQIKAAMSRVSYRRKTPNNKQWSASTRRIAELFKMFVGTVPAEALLAQMPKGKEAEQAYWKAMNTFVGIKAKADKGANDMFSIGARMNMWATNA
jgi:hypothetical protein